MKKILSLLLVILLSALFMSANAQTFLEENFDGTAFPTGWTKLNNPSNWVIANSNNAGGTPRELQLKWDPQFNGKSRIMSPVIDLTGVSELVIDFLQRLDNYQGSHIIGVETTSDGGATWNPAFQKTFSSNQGSKISEVINTSDVGSATFQFCIFYQGNSYNINNWYFDNFKLFGRLDNDASLISLSALTTVNDMLLDVTGDVEINFTAQNTSFTAINSLEVRYQINDLAPITQTFSSLNIPTLGMRDFTFTQKATLAPGAYSLKVEILKVNGVDDVYPDNNAVTKQLIIAKQLGDRKVCIEHFTSSTCGPCVNPNAQMKTLLAANEGKFTITKYQMNWPGSGDPYYTAEGGTRRTYYGVSAVPEIYWNAKYSMAINQTTLNTALTDPAFVDITGNFFVEDDMIYIDGKLDSYIPITGGRLHVIVNEKRTVGNVTTNGEKEFFHVMMKMLPNAQGTTINAQAGESVPFNFSLNKSSTNIEEIEDLEVHVFLQDNSSKYIYNSNFLSDCIPPESLENLEANVNVENKSVHLSWENPNEEPVTFTIFFNGTILQEGITETTYTHENVPAGKHSYSVAAAGEECLSDQIATSITICGDDPENLTAQQYDTSVVLTWEADYAGTYKFTVFFNGEILAENVTAKSYSHINVPGGEHTYGVLAVIDECTNNTIETSIEVCRKPDNFNAEILENKAVMLTWEGGYGSYTIYFDGEQLTENITETSYIHENVPVGAHTYGIVAVGTDCTSELVTKTINVLSIGELSNPFKIYPNPANDHLLVEGNDIKEVSIYNNFGQVVKNVSTTENIVKINMKDISAGLYFIQIKTATGMTKTEKIVIQN